MSIFNNLLETTSFDTDPAVLKQYGYVLTEGSSKGALVAITKAKTKSEANARFQMFTHGIHHYGEPVVVEMSCDIDIV